MLFSRWSFSRSQLAGGSCPITAGHPQGGDPPQAAVSPPIRTPHCPPSDSGERRPQAGVISKQQQQQQVGSRPRIGQITESIRDEYNAACAGCWLAIRWPPGWPSYRGPGPTSNLGRVLPALKWRCLPPFPRASPTPPPIAPATAVCSSKGLALRPSICLSVCLLPSGLLTGTSAQPVPLDHSGPAHMILVIC